MELVRAENTSGYYGVYPRADAKTWFATIRNPQARRMLYLGSFRTAEAAAKKVAQAIQSLGKVPYGQIPRMRCLYGHVLTPENTYLFRRKEPGKLGVTRRCRKCHIATGKAQREAKKRRE